MKDMLVVVKLKEGKFDKFMGFMQSEQGINERKKIADVSKTIASVSPDKSTIMFKIVVHDMAALHSFMENLLFSFKIFRNQYIYKGLGISKGFEIPNGLEIAL